MRDILLLTALSQCVTLPPTPPSITPRTDSAVTWINREMKQMFNRSQIMTEAHRIAPASRVGASLTIALGAVAGLVAALVVM